MGDAKFKETKHTPWYHRLQRDWTHTHRGDQIRTIQGDTQLEDQTHTPQKKSDKLTSKRSDSSAPGGWDQKSWTWLEGDEPRSRRCVSLSLEPEPEKAVKPQPETNHPSQQSNLTYKFYAKVHASSYRHQLQSSGLVLHTARVRLCISRLILTLLYQSHRLHRSFFVHQQASSKP